MVDVPDGVVTRARQGDVEAFRALLEAFEKPIFQTVYRLVGGRFPNEVEDITQDIFLKIFRSLDKFDADRGVKFSTWIYTFVKNHCFDVLKKRRVSMVPLDPGGPNDDGGPRHQPDAGSPTPGVEALNGELNRHIAGAVERLPADQRLVFVLRAYEGLDYREISQVAGCTEGTVKSRLYRAKEALRKNLRKYVLQEEA